MPTWTDWRTAKPAKDQHVDVIFEDGREGHDYVYAGGVILFMPPDHSVYTYAQPKFWRPHVK